MFRKISVPFYELKRHINSPVPEVAVNYCFNQLNHSVRVDKVSILKELFALSQGDFRCQRCIAQRDRIDALVTIIKAPDAPNEDAELAARIVSGLDIGALPESADVFHTLLELLSDQKTTTEVNALLVKVVARIFTAKDLSTTRKVKDVPKMVEVMVPPLLSLIEGGGNHSGRKRDCDTAAFRYYLVQYAWSATIRWGQWDPSSYFAA